MFWDGRFPHPLKVRLRFSLLDVGRFALGQVCFVLTILSLFLFFLLGFSFWVVAGCSASGLDGLRGINGSGGWGLVGRSPICPFSFIFIL